MNYNKITVSSSVWNQCPSPFVDSTGVVLATERSAGLSGLSLLLLSSTSFTFFAEGSSDAGRESSPSLVSSSKGASRFVPDGTALTTPSSSVEDTCPFCRDEESLESVFSDDAANPFFLRCAI